MLAVVVDVLAVMVNVLVVVVDVLDMLDMLPAMVDVLAQFFQKYRSVDLLSALLALSSWNVVMSFCLSLLIAFQSFCPSLNCISFDFF